MGTVDGADVPAQEMPVATATPLALTLTSPLPVRWQAHFRGSPQATPTFDGFPEDFDDPWPEYPHDDYTERDFVVSDESSVCDRTVCLLLPMPPDRFRTWARQYIDEGYISDDDDVWHLSTEIWFRRASGVGPVRTVSVGVLVLAPPRVVVAIEYFRMQDTAKTYLREKVQSLLYLDDDEWNVQSGVSRTARAARFALRATPWFAPPMTDTSSRLAKRPARKQFVPIEAVYMRGRIPVEDYDELIQTMALERIHYTDGLPCRPVTPDRRQPTEESSHYDESPPFSLPVQTPPGGTAASPPLGSTINPAVIRTSVENMQEE